jgi:hypothetical protein
MAERLWRPGRRDAAASSAADAELARLIADAVEPGPMAEDLADRLAVRLVAALPEVRRDCGPAPVLWLLPLAAGCAAAVLVAVATALGLPVIPLASAAASGVLALMTAVAAVARLSVLPTVVVAAIISALLLPRVTRMEVHR